MPRNQEHPLQELILDILRKNHLVAATELRQQLKDQGYQFNKTSIYRALTQLMEKNMICQHQFDLKEAKYELREKHHDHIVCQGCGKVVKFTCPHTVCHQVKDFAITHHHLTLFGFCQNCQQLPSE